MTLISTHELQLPRPTEPPMTHVSVKFPVIVAWPSIVFGMAPVLSEKFDYRVNEGLFSHQNLAGQTAISEGDICTFLRPLYERSVKNVLKNKLQNIK